MTRLASAVTTSGPSSLRDQPRGLGQRHEPMLDHFAVLACGHEVGGQPEVVDEDRLALQAVRLLAADVHGARGLRRAASGAAMPASSHASLTTVAATDCPAAMPPPTRLSSMPGIDRLGRAAPRDPHRDRRRRGGRGR